MPFHYGLARTLRIIFTNNILFNRPLLNCARTKEQRRLREDKFTFLFDGNCKQVLSDSSPFFCLFPIQSGLLTDKVNDYQNFNTQMSWKSMYWRQKLKMTSPNIFQICITALQTSNQVSWEIIFRTVKHWKHSVLSLGFSYGQILVPFQNSPLHTPTYSFAFPVLCLTYLLTTFLYNQNQH